MSARYVAEAVESWGLSTAWDIRDTKTGEFMPVILRDTAEDAARALNNGANRDFYPWEKDGAS